MGIIFPRDKAKTIGEAFLKYMGSEVARPLHETNKGLIFSVRKDCLNKAEKFSYNRNKYDFKLTVKSPQAKGIIHVPKSANITKIKQELQAQKNVESFLTTFGMIPVPVNLEKLESFHPNWEILYFLKHLQMIISWIKQTQTKKQFTI